MVHRVVMVLMELVVLQVVLVHLVLMEHQVLVVLVDMFSI